MSARTPPRPLLLCAWLILVAAAHGSAQPAGPAAGGLRSGGPPESAQLVTDVFVGRNVVGPYTLTWKGLDAAATRVSRDGFLLTPGLDYALDPAAGVLKLSAPLRTEQIVRVDYLCEPGKATRNTGAPSVPLEFKLLQGAGGALSLNALYRPPDLKAGASAGSGLMLLGLGGQSTLAGGTTIASKLFLDARGGDLGSRTGLQLGESTKTSFGKFGMTFARAGSQFAAAEESGIVAGRQALEATGALNPVFGITASASFRQTVELPAAGKGATVNVLGERLAGVLFGQLRFQASHTETTTDPGDGAATTRTADRIQLDQKLGDRTQATALLERSQSDSDSSHAVAQTSTLQIRSRPTEAVTVAGSYQNRLLPSGPQDATSLRVDADAAKGLRLGAAMSDQVTRTSTAHTREATLEFAPSPRYMLGGSLGVKASGGSESLAGGLTATARPNRFLEVTGGVRLRSQYENGIPDPTTPDTYSLKVALNVFRNALRLTGGLSDNPEDDKGTIARASSRNIGLQSTIGSFDLTGSYALEDDYLSTVVKTIIDLKFGWRFARASSLITSFREALTQNTSLTAADTYSLSLTHRLGSVFDLALSGVMTTYEKDGIPQPNHDYRAEAKLGVRF